MCIRSRGRCCWRDGDDVRWVRAALGIRIDEGGKGLKELDLEGLQNQEGRLSEYVDLGSTGEVVEEEEM